MILACAAKMRLECVVVLVVLAKLVVLAVTVGGGVGVGEAAPASGVK